MGMHTLNTSSFPGGTYRVRVEVYRHGKRIRSKQMTVNKPFSNLRQLINMPNHQQYAFWTGVVDPKNKYNFTEVINGFSFGRLLGKANSIQFGSYIEAGKENLLVSQITDYQYTTFGTWSMTGGLDNDRGYAFNAGYNGSITEHLSVNANYYQNESKNTLSPFYTQRSADMGVSYNSSRLGILSIDYQHSFNEQSNDVSFDYNKTLYQSQTMSVSLNLGRHEYNDGDQDNRHQFSNSVLLQFSFNMDDGSSLQLSSGYDNGNRENSSNFEAQWNPSDSDNSVLSSLNGSWSHRADSDSFMVGESLNNRLVSGSLGVSKTFSHKHDNGFGYTAGLSGSFMLADNAKHVALSPSNIRDSGVMIDATIPNDRTITAVIDGESKTLYSGVNFIPATAYEKHSLYVQQSIGSSGNILHIPDIRKNFTLYPGNIDYIKVATWNTQLVIGQLIFNGHMLPNVSVRSDAGNSMTDQKGFFMITSKMRNKHLKAVLNNGKVCMVQLSDKNNDLPSIWEGKTNCILPKDQPHSIVRAKGVSGSQTINNKSGLSNKKYDGRPA